MSDYFNSCFIICFGYICYAFGFICFLSFGFTFIPVGFLGFMSVGFTFIFLSFRFGFTFVLEKSLPASSQLFLSVSDRPKTILRWFLDFLSLCGATKGLKASGLSTATNLFSSSKAVSTQFLSL